jgi:hypothetical protein
MEALCVEVLARINELVGVTPQPATWPLTGPQTAAHNKSRLADWVQCLSQSQRALPPGSRYKYAHIMNLLFIPRVICEHGEPWWWWCRLRITPESSTRALWQSYQQRHLGKVGGIDKGVWILPIHYLRYLKRSLTYRKILRNGTFGFTSCPKERVLWIFIAHKNPSPWPGFNTRPLGQVASTLTTTPPLRLQRMVG